MIDLCPLLFPGQFCTVHDVLAARVAMPRQNQRVSFSTPVSTENSIEVLNMASILFEVLKLLEERRIGFFIERDRHDGLTITAVLVGKRVEISVTEDETVDVAVFRGNEMVEVGMDAVRKALEEDE